MKKTRYSTQILMFNYNEGEQFFSIFEKEVGFKPENRTKLFGYRFI